MIWQAAPTLESERFYPTATDGYWVMLAPLPAGDHWLQFRGFFSTPDGGQEMVQNISYHRWIKE